MADLPQMHSHRAGYAKIPAPGPTGSCKRKNTIVVIVQKTVLTAVKGAFIAIMVPNEESLRYFCISPRAMIIPELSGVMQLVTELPIL